MNIIDTIRAPIGELQLTDEGYLYIESSPIARPGVFPYMTISGLSRQAKLPEDLFSETTIQSANGKPITNDHPTVQVNAENFKQYEVGMTMNDAAIKNNMLTISMNITDPETIKAVQAGKRELSIGFSTDNYEVPGAYNGVEYDIEQKNIRINHVAIVEKGRAGSEVALNLDKSDVYDAYLVDETSNHNTGGGMNVETIKVNGKVIKLSDEDAQEQIDKIIADLKKKTENDSAVSLETINGLTAANNKLEGENAALSGKVKQFEADADDLKAKAYAQARSRVDLEAKAIKMLGDSADMKLSDRELKIAMIANANPAVKIAADASDDYVNAAFDVSVTSATKVPNLGVNQVADNEDEIAKMRNKRLFQKEV